MNPKFHWFNARLFSINFALLLLTQAALAVPYASKVLVTGTTVTFILNEPADLLGYRLNGGGFQTLDGSSKGLKTFSLNAATDKFAIFAGKNASTGFTIPNGQTIPIAANGLSQPSAASGFNLISDDLNPLNRFNSPRGVSVSLSPNAINFGTVYIANSAAGTTTTVIRNVGDGLYALNADQSDAFGYGDTAMDPGNYFDAFGASANSPFKLYAATNGEVYVADFSDANSNVYRENPDLTVPPGGVQVFTIVGGAPTLPPGQNHGSAMSVYVEGSLAGGDLVVYTVDEDYRTTPSGTDDRSSLWRYSINSGPLPSSVTPIRVNQSLVTVPVAVADVNRGKDGKWYLSQNRVAGNEAGIIVLDPAGVTLFDSLSATRSLLGNPTAVDIFRNVQATAISPDQKWLAAMLNNSDVVVVPLINGIPDIASRLLVDTGADITSGRDISFDAAGNIHYVSSGQALYRVLAPGGTSWTRTAWDGTAYSFSVGSLPELQISQSGSQVKIEWPFGVLQESSTINGPWSDSANQVSPYIFTPTGEMKFFRLRGA
jgi:hypothetical protein